MSKNHYHNKVPPLKPTLPLDEEEEVLEGEGVV